MSRMPRFVLGAVLAPALLLGAACIEPAPVPVIEVRITGAHSVAVGETLALSASTANGSDPSYRWSVEDESVAIVDESGTVTGVAAGETLVRAEGASTGVSGSHVLVVLPAADGPARPDGPAVEETALWRTSAHADPTSPAFTHWDEAGEVPTSCARCHSTEGYRDYLGADGSAPGSVEAPGATGSLVRCSACHNDAARELSAVSFPSGATVSNLGPEARCIVCHQGRASGADVDARIANADVTGPDEASSALGFVNIHYYPAAATLFAGTVQGGYQYEGHVYDTRFRHVPGFDSCIGCHEPHSTRVRFQSCAGCHDGASDLNALRNVRMIASRGQDYDGDGDTEEGIYYEIQGLLEQLLTAIQRYGSERGEPVCYGEGGHPYWFVDTNRDGSCDDEEMSSENAYRAFTPRLLKAAYNYQMAKKDPGAFAHNAKYVIQLLHDSILDVTDGLVVAIDTSQLVRTDVGHFNGASEAARHWDADEAVTASCSRCHSGAPGFRFFLEYGVGLEVPETANGLECATCHTSFGSSFDVLAVEKTHFPGDKILALDGNDNLCANCHSGRASTATIDAAIARGGALSFQNVHYLPAAGTLYGSLAAVGYEYEGQNYAGKLTHTGGTRCTTCHDAVSSQHTFRIKDAYQVRCDGCHGDYDDAREIRLVRTADYDGDGNTSEPLADEIDGMAMKVLAAMNADASLCYSPSAYPYFFVDTNGSGGICEASEAVFANRFTAWTPALVKAAHNFQLSRTEPGAWAHNFDYMAQLLFDSAVDVSGSSHGMNRP